jgi:hypothetical protein
MNVMQIPTPPLRFWPIPPSNEGLLESMDTLLSGNDENILLDSERFVKLANERLRLFSRHIEDVINWTEKCHAESECHPIVDDGKHWLQFVTEVKDYVEHCTQSSNKIQQDIIRIQKDQLSKLQDTLLKRLEDLENDCQQIESKIHVLLSSNEEYASGNG